MNNYTALTIAGISGYLMLTHWGAQETASFTADYGMIMNIPSYEEASFVSHVQTCMNNSLSGKMLASAKLLKYCMDANSQGVPGSLFTYFINQNEDLEYSQPKQLIYQYFNSSLGLNNGVYASEDSYKRTLADTSNNNTNMVCSSCRANLTLIQNSDYRIVKIEMGMNSTLKQNSNLQGFYQAVRQYPLRNINTAAVNAY